MPIEQILLVEDEAIIGMALAAELEDRGYTVVDVCPNGQEALLLLQHQAVDLVILDIKLGKGLDGLETLAEIRKLSNPRVIVISGNSEQQTLQRIQEADIDGFLIKPVSMSALHQLLEGLKDAPAAGDPAAGDPAAGDSMSGDAAPGSPAAG
jgi:two-component system, response regulator PdtaR